MNLLYSKWSILNHLCDTWNMKWIRKESQQLSIVAGFPHMNSKTKRGYALFARVITTTATQTTRPLLSSQQYESQSWWEQHWLPANPSSDGRVPQPCYYSPHLSWAETSHHRCLLMGVKTTTNNGWKTLGIFKKIEHWVTWADGGWRVKMWDGWSRSKTE